MRSSTEEFLYVLLWGAEALARPTTRTITESFEGWAYRTGVLRRLRELEHRKLVEQISDAPRGPGRPARAVERIFRLTETGRIAALGGVDPEQRWDRRWDGKWRMIVFDLPEKRNASRVRLRRVLKERGFGYLQQSVWISPDPLDDDLQALAAQGEDVETILTLAVSPCSGESDASIVAGSWDFEKIGRLHQECLRLLKNPPSVNNGKSRTREKLREWASQERAAWKASLAVDPLLPKRLLPQGYLGLDVWRLRNSVLREAGQWLS